MLRFSSEQMVGFEHTGWKRFIEDLTARLADDFPITRQSLGPDAFLRAVHENANAARETFDLQEDEHIETYVRYCFRLGSGFDADISVYWAGDILHDPSFVLTNEKMSFLESEFLIYLNLSFDPEDGLLPRHAYRTYAAYLTENDLSRSDQKNVVSMMEHVWPEKARICEYQQLREFAEYAVSLADGYGLEGEVIMRRYALMAFILGARFDMDPVHPWAAEILRDETTDPEQTMRLLEQAALEHVLHPWIATLESAEDVA